METKEEMIYAGFWVRVLAAVIDGLILAIPITLIEALFGEDSWVSIILLLVLWWQYNARMLSSSWRATIGKKIVSIEVVNEMGEQITFKDATFRFLYSLISYLLLLPILMMLFTEKKQTLHDKMAKTLVLDSAAMSDGSTYSNVKFIRVIGYILLAIVAAAQVYTMGMMIFFYLVITSQDSSSRNDYSVQNSSKHSTVIEQHKDEAEIDEYLKNQKLRIEEEKKSRVIIEKENKKLMYEIRKKFVQKDRNLIEIEELLKQSIKNKVWFSETYNNLLYTALEKDDYNASKLLLEKGLITKDSSSMAFSRATFHNTSIELFNMLLRYYLNPIDEKKARGILFARIYKKATPKRIENILEYVVDINDNPKYCTSVLGTAIESCSSIEIIKLLLDHGAKLNEDVKLKKLLRKSSYKCRYRKDIEELMNPKPIIKSPEYKELIRMDS